MDENTLNKKSKFANFNCTFRSHGIKHCMLDYFESIIWPAFTDYTIIREVKRSGTKFHLADVKIIELPDGNLALVGIHIKKTFLDKSPDYDETIGFFGDEYTVPSAPYSTFILLLNNHRLIYFPNKKGAPSIDEFCATAKYKIREYISLQRQMLKNKWSDNDSVFDGVYYKYLQTFNTEVLEKLFPYPEINIIPIESETLVKESFKTLKEISVVTFKVYKPNNEPVNFNNIFERMDSIIDETDSEAVATNLVKPTKFEVIEDAIITSSGHVDFKLIGKTENDDDIILTPDKVSQKVNVQISPGVPVEVNSIEVYNQVNHKSIIRETSSENLNVYQRVFGRLKTLIK
ncbi:hypothetical protein [Clostridium culturomicium]|uniref:hypothetical protein n=1 Tax=Clostridium culturomicium TaxID=1499683 RepID=UPI00058B43CE|nr:hypothetical protein [Clostridium culturomicium]